MVMAFLGVMSLGCTVTDLDAPPSVLHTSTSVTQGDLTAADPERARIKQVLSEVMKGKRREDKGETEVKSSRKRNTDRFL